MMVLITGVQVMCGNRGRDGIKEKGACVLFRFLGCQGMISLFCGRGRK